MTSVLEFLSRVSPHFLIFLFGVAIVAGLMLYFWVWYRWPRSQVPIHFSPHELKVLEVQDQIRKTQIQIPLVVALVAIFVMVLVQFGINSRQWATDFELRSIQAQSSQYTDAVRALSEPDSPESHVAGIYSLQALVGLDTDRNIRRVNDLLAATVRAYTREEKLRVSVECNGGQVADDRPRDREEAEEDVRAALGVIGNKRYSDRFDWNYDPKQRQCVPKAEDAAKSATLARRAVLEHRFLDNLDLAATDFSCTRFSGSRFRRTSFEWANLQGADFRAAIFEAKEVLGLPDEIATSIHANGNGWRRYRCWSTFFKSAFLDDVDFSGAQLTGAVFENASLGGAKFNDANITLADFRGAKGLTADQFAYACVKGDKQPLFDKDVKITISKCPEE